MTATRPWVPWELPRARCSRGRGRGATARWEAIRGERAAGLTEISRAFAG